jgi:GNAT superfamily N-acetyltransferase
VTPDLQAYRLGLPPAAPADALPSPGGRPSAFDQALEMLKTGGKVAWNMTPPGAAMNAVSDFKSGHPVRGAIGAIATVAPLLRLARAATAVDAALPMEAASAASVPSDEILGVAARGRPGVSIHDVGGGGKVVIARNPTGAAHGYLQLQKSLNGPGYDALDVLVNPEARGKGVATSLYKTASEAGLSPQSGTAALSAAGDALTRHLAALGLTARP